MKSPILGPIYLGAASVLIAQVCAGLLGKPGHDSGLHPGKLSREGYHPAGGFQPGRQEGLCRGVRVEARLAVAS
ncbi:unnamed protein product, partial [Staurois parvus]